ncbi:putative transcriptional regulatory C11D3.07c-like protein [Cladobotryum mycophilum]|uniref:Transcriptional regulatory C11D3.07c-like protein n=1 Tax=Cladobotryum mycophilum TaxID=491253 RepID=A0ABR0SUI9_9HYPO
MISETEEPEELKVPFLRPQPEGASIQQRLDRIEASLGQITSILDRLVKLSENSHGSRTAAAAALPGPGHRPGPPKETVQSNPEPERSQEPSPASSNLFYTMSQTSHDLSTLQNYPEHEVASRELRGLLDSLKSFEIVGDGPEISEGSQYYIPDKQTGYTLIGHILHVADLGSVLFKQPTDEVVRQVIFEPSRVKSKAWLLYINYTMVAIATSAKDQFEPHLVNALRWNTRLALNNSSIFLEPSELNIQALMLAALHGEDFAAPNLSWMLIGHACQQAKALLATMATEDFGSQQRRLCLFWSLFSVDKSCSLAFGRPVFLPASLFKAIPLPDIRYLLRFNPHQDKAASHDAKDPVSTFGGNVFLQNIALAILTSRISDFLHGEGPEEERKSLMSQLDNWHRNTEELLYSAVEGERAFASERGLHEMSLGILSCKFQYLHLLILLTEKSPQHAKVRTISAREAISILPQMVSNWSQVYNGIIWQSLYYPFTPFFVLFQRIIQDPMAGETKEDLGLLASTVAYFTSMASQVSALGPLVRKLEQTAEVLLKLAQRHVMVSASKQEDQMQQNTGPISFSGSLPPSTLGDQPALAGMDQLNMSSFLEDIDMDSLISWLPQGMGSELELSTQGDGPMDMSTNNSGGEGEPRGQKRPFESAFDWFSWDTQFM